jgi:hypothetical protein
MPAILYVQVSAIYRRTSQAGTNAKAPHVAMMVAIGMMSCSPPSPASRSRQRPE